MAVKYSGNLNNTLNPHSSVICKACGLYLNQLPALDKLKKSHTFWVGLSAVQFDDEEEKLPLSPLTNSGKLIEKIENPFDNDISFYKTNLVKCLPLRGDKIRYPLEHEMEKCFRNFEYELEMLKPTTVFLLGRQVGSFVMKKLSEKDIPLDENFNYDSFSFNNIGFFPIHHPSYILVYKRKNLQSYIDSIRSILEETIICAV
jgi:uracil-DNA glycosylase family 4